MESSTGDACGAGIGFFQCLSDRLVTDRVDDVERDEAVGQQARASLAAALRGLRAR